VAAGLCAIVTFAYAGSFGQLVFDAGLADTSGTGQRDEPVRGYAEEMQDIGDLPLPTDERVRGDGNSGIGSRLGRVHSAGTRDRRRE
jgi:hypothetical protein